LDHFVSLVSQIFLSLGIFLIGFLCFARLEQNVLVTNPRTDSFT
jgi:hypothetical protein